MGAPEAAQVRDASVDAAAGCEHVTRLLLTAQLVQMAIGRADKDTTSPELARIYDPQGTVMQRAQQVNTELLRTAAGDLLGPFHRDVAALLVAYQPRIVAGCGTR